ncbi:MAG TPA: hypothetical protein VF142_14450 [Longimicrobium sp.]
MMRNGRMISRGRAALLAALAVLGLGACEGGATEGIRLIGSWQARLDGSQAYQSHRLELTPTTYVWIQESYGPGGRPGDSLQDRFTHSGDWEMRGDRLALRARSMEHWSHSTGDAPVEFVPRWDEANRVLLQGDRMTIEYRPPPEQSYMRPTLHFERVR